MTRLPEFIRLELDQIAVPVASIERLLALSEWDAEQKTAFGTYVQNVYMGIKRVMQFMLKERGETLPKSPTWHLDALKLAIAYNVIPETAIPVFTELLKYRHRHIHGYGHMLDETRLRELAAPIAPSFTAFREHCERLYAQHR